MQQQQQKDLWELHPPVGPEKKREGKKEIGVEQQVAFLVLDFFSLSQENSLAG